MSAEHGNTGHSHAHGAAAAPPEPSTPLWFTALGVVLFLVVGLLWGLSPSATVEPAGGADAGAAAPTN